MTVAELIERLKEMPQDMQVGVSSNYSGFQPMMEEAELGGYTHRGIRYVLLAGEE